MRYILLDIDGVMVEAKSWSIPPLLDDGFYQFTRESTNKLISLIGPDTIIVLTTTHRFRFTTDQWLQIFLKRGIKIGQIQILPESNDSKLKQITHWCNINKSREFIIIDDDSSLNDLPKEIKQHLIFTQSTLGLI